MANITIFGAGSAAFSVSFIRDLCTTPKLWGSRITLMDIDEARLGVVAQLAERFYREAGASFEIIATTDRRKSLEGAEYVVCAVKVGGYEPLERERAISEEHGYYRGIGDRVSCYYGGVGAYHQLQFFLDLARDMEAICPDAWLIETANPVFEGTNLLIRESRIKAVGVCHGHLGYRSLAGQLGLDPAKLEPEVAGFNHCVWLTRFHYNGEDAYPLIDRWIEQEAQRFWQSEEYTGSREPWAIEDVSPGAVDAYRLYGLYPIGDTVRSASPWWHHLDLQTKQRWYGPEGGFDSEIAWPRYLKRNETSFQQLKSLAADPSLSLLKKIPLERSDEQHIPLIESLATDTPLVLQLNIPNRGAMEGIPDDVVVEIPALADGDGIQGMQTGRLPERLMRHVLLPRMHSMETILQAFRDGDRKSLVLMLMEDPRTKSYEQAQTLIDTLLSQPWNTAADLHYR